MEFSGLTARDLPAPATLAQDAAAFRVPVHGLVPQPRLRMAGHGTTRSNAVTQSISISYSYLSEPDDPESEANFVEGIEEVRGWIRKAEADGQPDWFKEGLEAARYPMLWEAVLTEIDEAADRTLDEHLADHVNHLLINTMEHRRSLGADHVLALDHGVRPSHAQPATIRVGGVDTSGRVIDTDPDVVGWAVRVDEAIVIVGLPRDRVDDLVLELAPLQIDG